MKPLDRKLLRDLRRLAPQLLAIALLGAIGVAVAVTAYGALEAIETAQAQFYAQTRFADLFAGAERAPRSLLPRLQQIEGVLAVDGRASGGGLMNIPGLQRPAAVELIALPDDPAGALNGLVLSEGRMPAPGRKHEAVALKSFLDAARVELGDSLSATVSGRRVDVTIVGSVRSPEYVYSPGVQSMLPDDAHQAVIWAPRATVEEAAGEVGAFSRVSLKLAAGVNPAAVAPAVDRILAPYGGTPVLTREDQPSHAFLSAEFKQLRSMALFLPPIFLAVAAGLTHMVIGRLVETEREQIGQLKAFGYADREAAEPYLKTAALIGAVGALAGGALGAVLATLMTNLYAEYFRFPVLEPRFNWQAFLLASAAAVAASIGGSALAVRRVAALRPAVAMQAAPPTAYRRGLLDWLNVIRALDQPTRMVLRRIERFPGKAALTVGGLAVSLALLVGTQFLYDSVEAIVDTAYYRAQRWNRQVSFFHPREIRAVTESVRLPGVVAAEPVRNAVAWARGRPGADKKVIVRGLEPDALLERPLDAKGRPIPLVGRAVVISRALGKRLDVGPGDRLDLEVLEGRRPRVLLPVSALAEDYAGLTVYISRRELNRILGEGDLASGADLIAAGDQPKRFYAVLTDRPQIIATASRDDTVQNWRAQIARSFTISITIYLSFAGAIAFGVAYNMGRITLAERSRDLATLQVLGFSRGECAYILFGEIALLALAATPLGIVMGSGMAHGLAEAFSTDEMRIPVDITRRSLAVSITAFAAAVGVAALLLVRRLWRLDLVGVLKTRE